MRDIKIRVIDILGNEIGTVGKLYYERYSIKQLVDMYGKVGLMLRFY